MALVPCGAQILGAHRCLMERLSLRASVGIGESNRGIEYVDSLGIGNAELGEPRGTIGAELSQVHVE